MYPVLTLAATLGDKIDTSLFGFDTAVFTFFGNLQNSFLTIVAKLFTSMGDENFIIPVVVLAAFLCIFKKIRKYGVAVIAAVAVGTILTNLWLKPMVLRVRPYNTLQLTDFWPKYSGWYASVGSLSESDYSFPSGHTTSAFEVAIAVCLCLISDKKGKVAWIPPVLALGTACSRIYLMVHYPSDVVAGACVGICAGIVGFFASKLVCLIFDKLGLEDLFRLKIYKPFYAIIAVALVVAYSEEYDCNNKARIGEEKYPPIDGKNYCKIHWKQLTAEAEEGESAADEQAAEEITDAPAAEVSETEAQEIETNAAA